MSMISSVQLWNITDGLTTEGRNLLSSLDKSTKTIMLCGPARSGKSLLGSAIAAARGRTPEPVFKSASSLESVTQGIHGAHIPDQNLVLLDCEGLAALIGSADDRAESEDATLNAAGAAGVFAAFSDGLVFVQGTMPDGDKVNMLSTMLFNRVSVALTSGAVDSSCVTSPRVLMAVRSHKLDEWEKEPLSSREKFQEAVVSKMLQVENASLEGRVKAHVMSMVDVGLIPQLKGHPSKLDVGEMEEEESWHELQDFCQTRILSMLPTESARMSPLERLERLITAATEGNALKQWGSSLSDMVGKVEAEARQGVEARIERMMNGEVEDGQWLSGMKAGTFMEAEELQAVRVWWSILVPGEERAQREAEMEQWVREKVGQLEVDLMWKAASTLQDALGVFESHVVEPLAVLSAAVSDLQDLSGAVEAGVEHMVRYAAGQVGGLSTEHSRVMAELALATLWKNPEGRLQKAVRAAKSSISRPPPAQEAGAVSATN